MLRSRFLWKLYAGYVLLILGTAALIGALVAKQIEKETLADTDDRLLAVAVLMREIALSAEDHELDQLQDQLVELDRQLETRLTVVRRDGVVLGDSRRSPSEMDNHRNRPEILEAYEKGQGAASRRSTTLGQRLRYLAIPIEREGTAIAVMRSSLPLAVLDERLASVRRTVLLGAGLATAAGLLLGLLLAGRVTRPLLEMAEAAERIADGAYGQRVLSHGRDELGMLARAFNKMSQELRRTVATLDSDRKKLGAILASMDEGLVAVDRDERIVHMNAAAGELLQIDPASVVSHPIWEVTRLRGVSEALREVLRSGQPVERVVRLAGTRDRLFELRAAPLSSSGDLSGALLVVEDVTQLRHLETMRQDFVANVSHELKTPVTVIRGMVETMLDDPDFDPERRHHFLQRVLTQAGRMGDLVKDLLSLAQLESDPGALEIDRLDLRLPVEASIRALQPMAESRGVRFDSRLTDSSVLVRGDEEALRQAIGNLLSNAVKYSPKNGVVEVRVVADESRATVEVEDHGVGIPAHHRERLFERFYRVDKARSRALGGTGLGLAIVKHITRALGGTVSVDSAPGQGSTFRIHLARVEESGRIDLDELGPLEEGPRAG
ncbi:MAG: ATP-binding protein [Acidobacteriota bacterium]